MNSTSQFDFNNEGDCILANESLKPHDSVSSNNEYTYTFMDLMMLSTCSDIMCHDIEMTEQQMSQLKNYSNDKPKIKPFIDCIDLNESDKELVNEVKPKPAVVIGIKGEF